MTILAVLLLAALPNPQFAERPPVPRFPPRPNFVAMDVPVTAEVRKEAAGHWETSCDGVSCRRIWVPDAGIEDAEPTTLPAKQDAEETSGQYQQPWLRRFGRR